MPADATSRTRASNLPDSATRRRTRMLRLIKIEDDHLKKIADEIAAELRRLTAKREHVANLLRERELAEGGGS